MHRSLLAAALLTACAPSRPAPEVATPTPDGATPEGLDVPLLEGMGGHHRDADTHDALAQRYFDQGMALAYGFNHAEARRAFEQAAALDPTCGMCWWGVAWTLGPNINAPQDPEVLDEARQAVVRARELAADASAADRALIVALAPRYAEDLEQPARTAAHAVAMEEVVAAHPDDLDARVLLADARMIEHPWDYWDGDAPQPWTPDILDQLETVLAADPEHPYANHLYIHAVEAGPEPERGLPSADRLAHRIPGAGHLVHMPGHIYLRTGRFHEVTEANLDALEADATYLAHDHAEGLYPLAYHPHNAHFLWMGAAMEGRDALAAQAAAQVRASAPAHLARQPGLGTLQHFWATPLFDAVRFGRWEQILDEPTPPEDLVYERALLHWARGTALAATGDPAAANAELEALRAVRADPRLDDITIWDINQGTDLVDLADAMLEGEIAASRRDWPAAVDHLQRAVALEDALRYDEPPSWLLPVRHALGAAWLAAGRPDEAERVYREDLLRFPDNGWSLVGLAASTEGLTAANAWRGARTAFAYSEAMPRRSWASMPAPTLPPTL